MHIKKDENKQIHDDDHFLLHVQAHDTISCFENSLKLKIPLK